MTQPSSVEPVSAAISRSDAPELTPEEQYRQTALLAQTSGGSQKRPPTPFVQAAAGAEPGEGEVSFNRDIRPILSDNCFACHGPDARARKADLRLDKEESAIARDADAEAPIVPGDPEASEFFQRLVTSDPDDLMPPADSHKHLTPQQIALFRRWIESGARWEAHWAYIAPVKSAPPAVARENWARNEIDRFVLARLEAGGLNPSPEADRHTLVRRVTLDLTGLPPTPEEVEAFVNDGSDRAYENLIDRLLESRAYGEHRARYWLDAARYGDTHGLHLDNYREIWPYRDWVIGAYNANLPFDRFTIEQIAGDLLPNASQAQIVATGFNRCNVTTSEGGAIAEEFLVRYGVDRVNTTATVWLGMTAHCAQCHDHKYDPLTMREFYQLFAFFNNTTQPGLDGNAKDSPPVIRVYADDAEKARAEKLRAEAGRLEGELKKAAKDAETAFQAWAAAPDLAGKLGGAKPVGETFSHPAGNAAEKPLELGAAGAFAAGEPFTIAFEFRAPEGEGRSVLLDRTDPRDGDRGWRVVVEDQGINVQLIESWPGKVLRSGNTRLFKAGASGHYAISYDGSGHSHGLRLYSKGKLLTSRFVNEWADTLAGDFKSNATLRAGGRDAESGLTPGISQIRFFDRVLSEAEVARLAESGALLAAARKPAGKRGDKETQTLREAFLELFHEPYRTLVAKRSEIEAALSRVESAAPFTLVMQEKPDGTPGANILERGEYDKPKEAVQPGVPDMLPQLTHDAPRNRLGLARWLVAPENPLVARVVVNRMWQELFGTGLVKTAEDFGTQGEPPTHPLLLDWLAVDFVESGWDMKALYRKMLLSATYRQSSVITPGLVKRDPENRLLARGPRYRLDAEILRDQALAASGLLRRDIGGPSVRPWQPSGIWEAVGYTNSNTQTFYQDYGATEHRRTLYTFWKRTAPPPNMTLLDAPNREDCVVRRERTNTPLQALVLMNDPQFVRAARYLGLRALNERDNVDGRLDFLAMLLLGRPLETGERETLKASLTQFENAWASAEPEAAAFLVDSVNPAFSLDGGLKPAPELASWAMVASQVMNLDESVTKH
ncbi:MAG: DUF1553 domain-containing protein [Verrucomicrobiae bacterium]|nr:DUF1553 domain-containing protein [Verrucomicrobiae bacterium]